MEFKDWLSVEDPNLLESAPIHSSIWAMAGELPFLQHGIPNARKMDLYQQKTQQLQNILDGNDKENIHQTDYPQLTKANIKELLTAIEHLWSDKSNVPQAQGWDGAEMGGSALGGFGFKGMGEARP